MKKSNQRERGNVMFYDDEGLTKWGALLYSFVSVLMWCIMIFSAETRFEVAILSSYGVMFFIIFPLLATYALLEKQ